MRPRVPARAAAATESLLERVGPGPGRLLELGGAGVHAVPFALAGWDVVVADEPERAARARERAGDHAAIVALDGIRLPFEEASFDVVLVEPGIDATEAGRVLRPGGRLVVAE